jgi:hypothetical protein
VRVTDICTGNFCWGTIKIEDKLPPVVTCTDIHVICAVTDYTPGYLETTLGIQNVYPSVEENCPPVFADTRGRLVRPGRATTITARMYGAYGRLRTAAATKPPAHNSSTSTANTYPTCCFPPM